MSDPMTGTHVINSSRLGTTAVFELADLFVRTQNSLETQRAYRYDLRTWFEWLDVTQGEISAPTLASAVSFKEFLTQKFSGRSAQRIFNTCRVFYRFLGGFNPFQTLKSPRATKNRTPIVPDDVLVIEMLEKCDNVRDRFILALLLNGLRRSEVVDLRFDSIEWSGTYGCDIIKVVGKGDKERLVPATLDTSRALRKYQVPESGQLFPGLTPRAVEYVSTKWTTLAGKKYSPHKMRHHYGTRLIRNGVGLEQLKTLLGHESVATTQIYVSLDLGDIVKAASLDPMNMEIIDATAND